MDTNNTNYTNGLTCQQLVELVTEFLEGAMDGATRARMAAHLVLCPPCAEYVEQIRRTIGLLARLETSQPSASDPSPETLALFRSWREPR